MAKFTTNKINFKDNEVILAPKGWFIDEDEDNVIWNKEWWKGMPCGSITFSTSQNKVCFAAVIGCYDRHYDSFIEAGRQVFTSLVDAVRAIEKYVAGEYEYNDWSHED